MIHLEAESTQDRTPLCGVLAIQGDVREHVQALARHGIATRAVRRPEHLESLDGIVLPGGESSTMLKMLAFQGLWEPLGAFLRSGRPVFATCAGLILCADDVQSPAQQSYGVLDVSVARNAWGRQIRSGTFELRTHGAAGLLFADSINMLLRIAYSCVFVDSYFKETCGGVRGVGLAPSARVISALGVASALARASNAVLLSGNITLTRMARHVGTGAALLLAVLAVVYLDVRRGRLSTAAVLGRRRKTMKRA